MKTHFFIIALAIFGMTLLTSCQKEEIDSSELATKENPVFTLKAKGGEGQPTPYTVDLLSGTVNSTDTSSTSGSGDGNTLYTQFGNGSVIVVSDDGEQLSIGAQFTSFEVNQQGQVVTTQFWITGSDGITYNTAVLTTPNSDIVDDDFYVRINQDGIPLQGKIKKKGEKPQIVTVAVISLGELHYKRNNGGIDEAVDSFEIVVSPFFNVGTYKAIRSGGITTLDGADIDLIWQSLAAEVCFDVDFSPEQRIMLNIRKEKRDGSAFVGYWFTDEETEIDYIIRMRGAFLNDWPPQSENLDTVRLDSYELGTTSGKNRNLACTTDGEAVPFGENEDVWVAVRRIYASQ